MILVSFDVFALIHMGLYDPFRRAPPKQKKIYYNVTKEKDQMIFLRMVSFCNAGGSTQAI